MTDETGRLITPVAARDHLVGPAEAPITLVEYGDYQCPYCRRAFPVVQSLQRHFEGSLRYAFRNLPLANVHPRAEAAAEMAEAVALSGDFWKMHELLFEHQRDLSDEALHGYAVEAGATVEAVDAALATGAPHERVQEDFLSAIRSGANGTPTFFVNGERYDGLWTLEPFTEYLEGLRS